jgi:serine protease AprX
MDRPRHHVRVAVIALVATALSAHTALAGWMWDQNNDKIDDRIVEVETQGITAAHKGGVLSGRRLFAVMNTSAPFEYGVYIGYDHHPTDADAAALEALGIPVQVRYRYIDYIRSRISFTQAQSIAQLPGVTRIETIPMMYPVNNVASRTLRGRESGQELFPNTWGHLGVTGKGITVGILDSGVNDAPDGPYPGHEALRGKWLGGGDFFAGDPLLNTPLNQSINPKHNADPLNTYHGTHVAGTAIGTGGPNGILNGATPGVHAGLAPDARLVDCKVLSDAGSGFGSADALEWCIFHRNDGWGLTGADTVYRGIDVINMSVGSDSESDGTDANCLAVNAAHKAGIVVCVASGNDGETGYMPSPAAADFAVTVGAATDNNSIKRSDDIVADFSNEGPRNADSDVDQLDEMKPNILGSGTGITSALGDPLSQGDQYHHINGTSMSCPTVAGVAALVRSANPTLSADQVRELLMDTAEHKTQGGKQPPSASDPFDVDPNYHPSWGWGEVDAYAAVKEALNAGSTQVVQISIQPQRGPDGIQVQWWSQREIGLHRWELDRAPDVNGAPGNWALVAAIPVAAPATQIHGVANRHPYSHVDLDPSLVTTATYWYRLRAIDTDGRSHAEPPVKSRIMDSPVLARVLFSWTHDFSDGDLLVRYGTGTNTSAPIWFRQAEGRFSADSIVTRLGVNITGTLQHYFHVDLTAEDGVGTYLPPSAANPWFLSVKEGGFIDTRGKVDDFTVIVFGQSGSTTYAAPDTTTETVEGQETVFWIPLNPALSVNHNPVLAPIGAKTVGEGLPLTFQVNATDPDGNPLTYSVVGAPIGSTFNTVTRTFSWTPGHVDAGSYSVRFRVFDNFVVAAGDSENVSITVLDRPPGQDLAPVMDPQTDRAGAAGQRLQFRITATDPEGAAVTYGHLGLPTGATLDPGTGIFTWTPMTGQIGIHPVTFTATDQTAHSDDESIYIVISAPGQQPTGPCTAIATTYTGIVGMGVDPGPKSYAYQNFTVPVRTVSLHGKLSWFGGPTRDLDFHLLDSDSNVVAASASLGNPEELVTGGLAPGQYMWRVTGFTNPDTAHFEILSEICQAPPPVGVGDPRDIREVSFAPGRPNPFRGVTALHFALPAAGEARLELFDVAGRKIRTLQKGWIAAGMHVRVWDRRTDEGALASPGIYFAKLEAGGRLLSRKLVMLK